MTTFDGAALAQHALDLSTSHQCQVIIEHDASANVRWAANSLTTNGITHTVNATVIAFDHRHDGIATASMSGALVDAESLASLVQAADAAARSAPLADDAAPLPEPHADVDYGKPAHSMEPDVLASAATGVGELSSWASSEHIETFGYVEVDDATTWFASSTGAMRRHRQRSERFETTAKSHDRTRSTWVGHPTAQPDWLAVRASVTRALELQGNAIQVRPGRYTTVLPSSATADLLLDLMWSAGAQDATEGRTAFHDPATATRTRLGQALGDPNVTLLSAPHDALAPSQPFSLVAASGRLGSVFDNGLDLQETAWIKDGRLDHLVTSSADSAQYGLPRAPLIDTLRANYRGATAPDVDALAAELADGLLLTCIWYVRSVDPMTMLLTGLTRDGVYVVRDGEIVGATSNFRFNDTPLGMLSRIRQATVPVRTLPREMADYANRVVMPALTVDEFNLTSVSDAR